ncbi:MAG: hypothetical protein GY756_00305, partial [bacterium]|nr:hypothetical protein [bacterium]
MRIQWILIVAVFLLTMIIHSDEFQSKGLEPLPSGLGRSMPQAQPKGIVTGADSSAGNGGDINQLPKRIDLSKYLPPVKSQGPISSCSAWSTVYYAKTIQENQERGWGADTLSHQYSPLFTYNQITGGVDRGTSIVEHMILLEEQGVPTLSDFPYTDDISILPNERVLK